MIEMLGCSISSVTKWAGGQLPVSRKAYVLLERVEDAVEAKVQEIVDMIEEYVFSGVNDAVIPGSDPEWEYGQDAYNVAATRARIFLKETSGGNDLRIAAPEGADDPLLTQPYLYSLPERAEGDQSD